MFDVKYPPPLERVIVVGLQTPKIKPELFEIDMKEMLMLCATAGAKVVDVVVQKRPSPVSSTYIGGGKLQELAATMKQNDCRCLIIDAPLSPGQVRNIEKIINAKVIETAASSSWTSSPSTPNPTKRASRSSWRKCARSTRA